MNVDVAIGVFRTPWRLLGAMGVRGWFAMRPWSNPEEPLAIHLPMQHRDAVLDVVDSELRRASMGEVAVAKVEARPTAEETLATWMDVERRSRRQLAETLVQIAAGCPYLFIVHFPAGTALTPWLDDLNSLLDIARKLSTPAHIGILLTSTGPVPPPLSSPLYAGWPEPVDPKASAHELWQGYVHERVAWHAAGHLDIAADLGAALSTFNRKDEAALEVALRSDALRRLDALEPTLLDALLRSTASAHVHPHLLIPHGIPGDPGAVPRPAPWLAQALLERRPNHPERRYLAALTVCRPLADRLLSRCQYLEQHCRDVLLRVQSNADPGESANRRFQLHRAGNSDEHVYAPGAPPTALSAWDFADFGDVISTFPPSSGSDSMHKLRRLRNLLAHGNAVGWRALDTVGHLERVLS